MSTLPAVPRRPSLPKWVVPAFGFLISAVSCYFAFRKFDYGQLGRDFQHLIWPWVLLGVAFELGSFVMDAWRWLVILSPAEEPTLLQAVQATFIGIFANDIVPAKAGEIIRPYLLSRWAEVPFSLSMTSAAMERIMDGVTMVICFYIASAGVENLPMWLRDGMLTLTVSVAIIFAAFLFILFYKSHAHRIVSGRAWTAKFIHLLDELHLLGCWQTLGAAFALSFGYFLCQFMAIFCLAKAYNFDFSLREAAFVLLVVRMVTLIPSAPGNIGAFQYACELALRMLMVEPLNAKSFALIAYFFMTVPALAVGAITVLLTGFSIGELHKQAHHAHREHEDTRAA